MRMDGDESSNIEDRRGEGGKVGDPRQEPGVDPAVREGPGEINQVGKRDKSGHGLRPARRGLPP